MKNRINLLIKISIFALLLPLIFLTCQKESTINQNHETETHNHSDFERMHINDLLKEDSVFSELSQEYIPPTLLNKNSSGKTTHEGLIITSDTINIVEHENYKSYTIRIQREGHEFDTENLVIEDNNGVKKAFILSYDFDNGWIADYVNGIHAEPEGTVYYSDFDITQLSSKTTTAKTVTCYELSIDVPIPCGCGHYLLSQCEGCSVGKTWPSVYPYSVTICQESSGGGDEDMSGGPLTTDDDLSGPGGGGGGPAPGGSSGSSGSSANLEDMAEFVEFKIDALVKNLSLNTEQAEWVGENLEESLDIYDFVSKDNAWSPKAKEFTKLAIDALMNDGELDFEKMEHLYVPMDKKCQANIITGLISTNNTSLTNFLVDSFHRNNENHLQLEDRDLPNGTIASTSYPNQPVLNDADGNGIIIYFDNSYLDDASDLSIVLTAAHEFVHARFGYLYIKGELLQTYPNYTDINNAFTNYYNNKSAANKVLLEQSMHDVYDDFLDEITDNVYDYAVNHNIGVTRDYCKKMVLGAHQNTDTFQDLTAQQQTEYSTITVNENEGNTNSKGTKCP